MSNAADNMIADLAERDFIVFAGAGIPNGDGKVIWRELLGTFKQADPNLMIEDINEVDESKYPDYAQRVYDAIGAERYHQILKQKLEATDARCSLQQLDIIETARHVVTTNFDDSFEEGMKRVMEGNQDIYIQSLTELQSRILNNNNSISYLHGRINEEFIIFKTDDYITFYPSQSKHNRGNDKLEIFLRHLYEERTIVFIGVSFNDEYLLNALNIFYNNVKQNDQVCLESKKSYKPTLYNIQHYAFMPKDMGIVAKEELQKQNTVIREQQAEEKRKNRIEFLEEIRIKVFTYEKHLESMDWLRKIRELQRQRKNVRVSNQTGNLL